jgi:hypothetical protein
MVQWFQRRKTLQCLSGPQRIRVAPRDNGMGEVGVERSEKRFATRFKFMAFLQRPRSHIIRLLNHSFCPFKKEKIILFDLP